MRRYRASTVEPAVYECVVNISEGRDAATIADVAAAGGPLVLDVHSDPDHHRSVLTLAGQPSDLYEAVRALTRTAVSLIDLRNHAGVHPRFGAVDVVPWVALQGWPLSPASLDEARAIRDRFAEWAGDSLGLPCFLYGDERTLPELRRSAWSALRPDFGPDRPHPTAGAAAVGARPALVAYNVWLSEPDLENARQIAAELRGPRLRTLALRVGEHVQVSCNLIDPWRVGPGAVYDAVARRAQVSRGELVGLMPRTVLDSEPDRRWPELGLSPTTTIEARLEQAGLDGGRFRKSTKSGR